MNQGSGDRDQGPGDSDQGPGAGGQGSGGEGQRPFGPAFSIDLAGGPAAEPAEIVRDLAEPLEDRIDRLRQAAYELAKQKPSWPAFYRALFGREGALRRLLREPGERAAFEASPASGELLGLLAQLRERGPDRISGEPIRRILVRLPAVLHDALKLEAHEREISLNQLCLSKLIRPIPAAQVPRTRPSVAGRITPPPNNGPHRAA